MGRPFGPQNDKINFMSPAAPIDGIMLSKLDTHKIVIILSISIRYENLQKPYLQI